MDDVVKIPIIFSPEINKKISNLYLLTDGFNDCCKRIQDFKFYVSSVGYEVEEKDIKFNISFTGIEEFHGLIKDAQKKIEELQKVILQLSEFDIKYKLDVG